LHRTNIFNAQKFKPHPLFTHIYVII
jgi:hypothetical protein